MPAPQMSGLASGIDTKDIVRKLVEVERAPIVRLENNKRELSDTSKALTELRKRTKTLQDSLHAMTSFEAAFEQKKLLTEPQGFLDGTVRKNATPSQHLVHVLKLASKLSIATSPVESNKKLSAAKIKIGDTTSNFTGGTLQSLREHLQKYHSKQLTSSVVRVKENESILVIDSVEEGEDALLKIEDPDGLLKSLGLLSGATLPDTGKKNDKPTQNPDSKDAPQKNEKETEESERWSVNPTQIELVSGRAAQIADDKKSFALPDDSVSRYRFLASQLTSPQKRLTKISLSAISATEQENNDNAPDSLSDGVRDNLNIKGIQLETYNITRTRQKEAARESDYGVVLHLASGDEKKISLKGKLGKQELLVDAALSSVDFYSSGIDVLVEPIELTYAVKPQPKVSPADEKKSLTPLEEEQRKVFPNLIQAAQNAELKIDGILVTRKTNKNIGDIIDGVSLNLLKPSPDNVKTEILNDTESAQKQVLNFVKAYNDLLQFAEENAKAARVKEAGKFQEMRKESGILATNATIRQLINGLKMHTSNAYPALRDPHFRTLSQIGISTGAVGADREEVIKGYLQVDEAKLTQAFAESPRAVKELFASDTNNDLRIDNGYAYVTDKFLDPFTRFTRGLIAEQIKSNAERTKQIDRDIKRQEEHVKNYEAKLKTKFGYMESSVMKNKSTGKFLKQKLGISDAQ
ncbi:MAG TPA: flagellar filament capping protein FliD [Turneriella sp.]|nr:flagellar filament capping protein FliD [Turneriella sp.]